MEGEKKLELVQKYMFLIRELRQFMSVDGVKLRVLSVIFPGEEQLSQISVRQASPEEAKEILAKIEKSA